MSGTITVDAVISLDLPNARRYRAPAGQYYIDCPFCGGHGKLNVNLAKNVWRCAKCGESGNAVDLHMKLTGITDRSSGYRDLMKKIEGMPDTEKVMIRQNAERAAIAEKSKLKPVSLAQRNRFYQAMLGELTLSRDHYISLRRRGLSDEIIKKNGYKSYPAEADLEKVAMNAYKIAKPRFGRNYMVPGAYKTDHNTLSMVPLHSGILIPCRAMNGMITGFQIRNDDVSTGAKYIWLSSGSKAKGCSFSGCENVHFAGNWDKVPKILNITEGVLKADVASYLSGKPFIGVPGVSNISQLPAVLKYLKEHGAEKVNICYDMDYREKKEVRRAMEHLKKVIHDAGLAYDQITWPSRYKGVDDYLYAYRFGKEIREGHVRVIREDGKLAFRPAKAKKG